MNDDIAQIMRLVSAFGRAAYVQRPDVYAKRFAEVEAAIKAFGHTMFDAGHQAAGGLIFRDGERTPIPADPRRP